MLNHDKIMLNIHTVVNGLVHANMKLLMLELLDDSQSSSKL